MFTVKPIARTGLLLAILIAPQRVNIFASYKDAVISPHLRLFTVAKWFNPFFLEDYICATLLASSSGYQQH
jgi:hypothetical protein